MRRTRRREHSAPTSNVSIMWRLDQVLKKGAGGCNSVQEILKVLEVLDDVQTWNSKWGCVCAGR
eukprot:352751-Alexandrium_andersonii.AAC.2